MCTIFSSTLNQGESIDKRNQGIMINFSIKFKPGLPVYEQVIYAVKKAIVSGQLKSGDRFPSIRELSKGLRINPNTAQKIISHLDQAGIITVKPGVGSHVKELSHGTEDQRAEILNVEVEKLVVESKRLLIKKRELTKAIEQHWGTGK